jgi:ubiquinone/menaquinone biosynthesis C-methylase UbiE
MKTIDHYSGVWDKKDRRYLLDRELISLNFIKGILRPNQKILDVGCGSGNFLEHLVQLNKRIQLFGIDYSDSMIKKNSSKHFIFKKVDLNTGILFKDESFNIVYAGEIIEHIYNPDFFLREINRVNKKNGYLILSTPNLCAWYNRLLILFGIQPLFVESSTKSNKIGAGILKKFKGTNVVGHLRIFNKDAIVDLLEANGFKILKLRGTTFQSFPGWLQKIDKLFAHLITFSSGFIILARKK